MANETQNTIGRWVQSDLGSTMAIQTKKLREEANEAIDALEQEDWANAAEEIADVVIVCMGIAFMLGFSVLKEINRKMRINRKRTWDMRDGVHRHV